MEKEYHFIGVGGIGMSALANILLDKQIKVSGSDLSESYNVKKLAERGLHFSLGHTKDNISSQKTVVFSSGIKKENPELQQALNLKCPVLHRSELLRDLMKGFQTLAVTGTHGKTTVSALLVSILKKAHLNPSFAIGGLIDGENGKMGRGEFFVAEADESDGSFLNYAPFGAIVTNVEKEHMDYYKEEIHLHEAFKKFFSQVSSPQHLFYCGDDPHLKTLSQGRGISYGFGKECALRISAFRQKGWKIIFDISFEGKKYENIEVALVGQMHALNAAASFGLALRLGVPESQIREALVSYSGVKRRLEKKGEVRNVLFLDDYGHHPTEIKKTLFALKEAVGERRVIVLFQPHRYSRTADLFNEFSTCFESADELFITDIYGASETPIEGVSSENLVKKIKKEANVPCQYLPKEACLNHFHDFLRPHDVFITIGAGDITSFHTPLLDSFSKKLPKKYVLGLVFGGRSPEHEISLRSSRFVLESLDPEYYEIKYFGIDKKGFWIVGDEAKTCLEQKTEVIAEKTFSFLDPEIAKELAECDLFFPVLHGPNGEDGTIQGFFEMMGKPYAGPDFRSCAVTMDKILTKKLLLGCGIPTAEFRYYSYPEWLKNKEDVLHEVETSLQYPVYVKPARLGSSIGVSKVDSKDTLEKAILEAFRFDETILIEEGVVDGRELEFAVVGSYKEKIDVPHPGEKCAQSVFVNYEMKYGQNSVKTNVQPIIEESLLEKGKDLAQKAYLALGITCMSRVDCLLDPKGNYCFFEINSIPGLTKLSLFPKIWAREGVAASDLVNRMVLLGLQRRRCQNRHEAFL